MVWLLDVYTLPRKLASSTQKIPQELTIKLTTNFYVALLYQSRVLVHDVPESAKSSEPNQQNISFFKTLFIS